LLKKVQPTGSASQNGPNDAKAALTEYNTVARSKRLKEDKRPFPF